MNKHKNQNTYKNKKTNNEEKNRINNKNNNFTDTNNKYKLFSKLFIPKDFVGSEVLFTSSI